MKFTVLAASGNTTVNETATIVQADLETIGIRVQVVPLEFRSLLDRVLRSRDYEAVVLRLGSGDVDPTSEMNVWMSSGATHLWNSDQPAPATGWEAEIDRLMEQQKTAKDPRVRKRLYDRVQEIVATELPIIPLVSPNLIVGVRSELGNFRPAVLDHYSLWNVEDLYWRTRSGEAPR